MDPAAMPYSEPSEVCHVLAALLSTLIRYALSSHQCPRAVRAGEGTFEEHEAYIVEKVVAESDQLLYVTYTRTVV